MELQTYVNGERITQLLPDKDWKRETERVEIVIELTDKSRVCDVRHIDLMIINERIAVRK